MTLEIHLFFASLLFLIPLRNLLVLYTQKNFIPLARKVRFLTPAYLSILAALLFTGFVLSAFIKDFISLSNTIMFIVFLTVVITEAKKQKWVRRITSKETEEQQKFIAFAKKKYITDLLLLGIAFAAGYYRHAISLF